MIRGLFIGCGAAGAEWLRLFLAEGDTRLAAVVEPSARCLTALNLPAETSVYDDLETALSAVKADVAFIASPSFMHAEQFISCARRGLHVFVEKPIALAMEDALLMREAAQEEGIKTATPWGAERHFFLRRSIELFRSGTLGRLMQIHAIRVGSNGFYSDVGEAAHYAVRQPRVSGGWIQHHLSHLIDWAMQIGGPVQSIYGRTDTTVPRPESRQEEAVAAILNFRGGGTAMVAENQLRHRYQRWAIVGDRGGQFISWYPEARGRQPYLTIETAIEAETALQSYDMDQFSAEAAKHPSAMRRFLDAIENDTPLSSLDRGIENLQLCAALHQSAETGQPVVVG